MKHSLFFILLCLMSATMLLGQSSENPFTIKPKEPGLDQLSDLELIQEIDRLNQINESSAALVKLDSLANHYYDDGNVVYIGELTRYTYDDRGNTLVEELLVYDEDSLTIYPEFKTTKVYNQDNQITSLAQEIYSQASQSYMLFARIDYFYQNNNLLDRAVTSSFNFYTMSFELSALAEYSYNGSNQLILTKQNYRSNNDWVLSHEIAFTYNGDLLTESVTSFYNPSTSMLIPSDRVQYTYNGQQRIDTQTASTWDSFAQAWMFSYRSIYTYDGNGNILSQIDEDYDDMLMMWVPDDKQESTFTNDNKVLTSVYSDWDTTENKWIPEERETYTYSNGNVVTYLEEEYDSDNNIWLNDNRTLATVDNSINVSDVIAGGDFTSEIFGFFTNAPDTLFNEDYDDDEMRFIEEGFNVFYYSPYSGTVNTSDLLSAEAQIKLIPNPAISTVQLQLEGQTSYELKAYDLTGRLIHSQQISNHQSLPIDHWQAGIYIVKVKNKDNQILQTKLVKM